MRDRRRNREKTMRNYQNTKMRNEEMHQEELSHKDERKMI